MIFLRRPGLENACILVWLLAALFVPTGFSQSVLLAHPENSSTSASTVRHSYSRQQRLQVFEQVWRLIDEKYYDPAFNGVDWRSVRQHYLPRIEAAKDDDELYVLLREMTAELHDAHTRFHSPRERDRVKRMQATSIGISVFNLDGKPVVTAVDPESDAADAGVEAGMSVVSVDGVPFAERLAEAQKEVGSSSSARAALLMSYHWIFAGEPGTRIRLSLQRAGGDNLDVTLTRRIVPLTPPFEFHLLPSGYAYIRFSLFNARGAEQFRRALEKFKAAPGLVVDLRGNPGGQLQVVTRVADSFFPDKVSFGRVITRSGGSPSLLLRLLGVPAQLEAGHPGGQIYAGPVVILVNDGSGSGAELFSAGMQENGRAAVVGRQTCGCVLATVAHKVRGGGEVDISEFGILTGRKRRLEGLGVVPDVSVPLLLDDLRSHHDAALREAVAILNSSAKEHAGGTRAQVH
jgi:carboxyl-terminal processing protease